MTQPAGSGGSGRPLEPVPPTPDPRTDELLRLIRIVERLRAPDGCPWDREQTLRSLDGTEHVIANWEAIKRAERAARKGDDASALAGVPQALGAVQRAQRLGAKAMAVDFRWDDARGALAKVREEVGELEQAFEAAGCAERGAPPPSGPAREHLVAELGDVLLACAQLANYLECDAEAAAREATRRFEARFRAMEAELGGELRGRTLDDLMAAWGRAKRTVDDLREESE